MPPIKSFSDLEGLGARLRISVDSSFGPTKIDVIGQIVHATSRAVDVKNLRLLNNSPYFTCVPGVKKKYMGRDNMEVYYNSANTPFLVLEWKNVSIEDLNGVKHINKYGVDLNNWPQPVLFAYFIRRLTIMASSDKQMLYKISKMYPTKDTLLQMITACRTIPQNKPKDKDTLNPILKKLFS